MLLYQEWLVMLYKELYNEVKSLTAMRLKILANHLYSLRVFLEQNTVHQ